MFWMLVRDRGPDRLYVQIINHYRTEPDALCRELPHHEPARVAALARSLSVVLWRDLVREVVQISYFDDDRMISIKNELWRRVSDD
jgi:hypothetical protein